NGTSATFYNSFRGNHQQWVNISGTKGYVEWKDFVLPYLDNTVSFDVANHNFVADGCRFNMEKYLRTVSVPEFSNNAANAQETNLFRNFSSLALSGDVDSHWPEIALKTQQVLDAALESGRNGGDPVML
ncbi:MAG: gfo/Idh/MocA family oxidoreductase, partial [Fuerstiella sp.]|nr:gfo/Idh/MocA family oxidoreductase [Fuerstiella sp.]